MHANSQKIHVRDLTLQANVGLFDHEKEATQQVIVNLEIKVEPCFPSNDGYEDVVCYGKMAELVTNYFAAGHVHTLETAAYEIGEQILAHARVLKVKIDIEKPDILPNARVAVSLKLSND